MKFINPLQPLLDLLPKSFTNKYYWAIGVFLVSWIFFSKHDPITQVKLWKSVDRLENDKIFYEEKSREIQVDRDEFEKNKEQYAREKYYMKRPGEEVFIIEEQ